jgi:1,4-dihydroxy-2-naphthoate polyprenyltransferase
MPGVAIDFERLAKFNYAIINAVGEDGFPFSLPTEFEVTPLKEILLKKPSSSFPLLGRKVGVLFNHISAIPTGGYTDRRYMLVWGSLKDQKGELKLEPESMSEWDEKILPFGELCAKAAPQGVKYLQTVRQIEA